MPDLKNPKLIYLKAFLFLFILLAAGSLLVLANPQWQTAALVLVVAPDQRSGIRGS